MTEEVHTSPQKKNDEDISFFSPSPPSLSAVTDPSELDAGAEVLINLTNTEVTCFRLAYQV